MMQTSLMLRGDNQLLQSRGRGADPITVEVPVIEDQYADFYYEHFGGTNEDTIGHQPPEPDNQMPWRDQLSEINQQTSLSLQGSVSGEQGCYYRDSG